MSHETVASSLIGILYQSGIRQIFGIIGDSLNPVGDAVRRHGGIEWISVRHEETAAFAAAAQAQINGNFGVCAGTCGPGSVHLVGGLYEATLNETPVLALATHIPSHEIGLNYFQETNPKLLFQDCSVYCEMISVPEQMPRILNEAVQTAFQKKGAAVLIIPKDVCEALPKPSVFERVLDKPSVTVVPNANDIQKAADIINAHQKIALYCGIGCKDAQNETVALAATLQAPVICTLRSKDFIDNGNPYCVGMNGLLSGGESSYALANCELLILLGNNFPFEQAIPTRPKIIQIDINAARLGERSPLALGVQGDVKKSLEMLMPLIQEKHDDGYLKSALQHSRNTEEKKLKALQDMSAQPQLHAEYLTHILSEVAPENTVFMIDVGLNDVWAARYLKPKGFRRFMGSFKYACMGAALPYAVGASYALDKDVPIVVLAGDGGISMYFGELMTVMQHDLPVKIIVYNNGALGFINWEAKMDRMEPFATELKNPDFAKTAQMMGFKTVRLTTPKKLSETLEAALSMDGPVLIDAQTTSVLGSVPPV